MRWTEERLAEYQNRHCISPPLPQSEGAAKKPGKFGNHKVKTEEGTFDSKWEYSVWCRLKMEERAGLISDLQRQVVFELIPAATLDSRKLPPVRYVADFVYMRDGQQVVEDAKGMESLPDYKLKRRMMFFFHGIVVREVRKEGSR